MKGALTKDFGMLDDGRRISGCLLENRSGTRVCVLTLGGIVQEFSLFSDGIRRNTVVSFDNAADYVRNPFQINKQIGRVAGRIAGAEFELGGRIRRVEANEGRNALHGGPRGLAGTVFAAERIGPQEIRLHATLREADDGYPNDLQLAVGYSLDDGNRLTVQYDALAANGDTVFDPTLHIYWQLPQDLRGCRLHIPHGEHIATDAEKLPTEADGNPVFDFRRPRLLGEALEALRVQTGRLKNGLDDIWRVPPALRQPAAVLTVENRYRMRLFSDRNGLVLFTAAPQDFAAHDAGRFNALATEAQTLPDSLHRPEFGNIRLQNGERRQTTLIFQLNRESQPCINE